MCHSNFRSVLAVLRMHKYNENTFIIGKRKFYQWPLGACENSYLAKIWKLSWTSLK